MTYPRNDNPIYADDPNAIPKLEAKIARLEAQRNRIIEVNAGFRKYRIDLLKIAPADWDSRLEPLNLNPDEIKYIKGSVRVIRFGRGYAPFHITTLTSNIKRQRKRLSGLRKRLAGLKADAEAVTA